MSRCRVIFSSDMGALTEEDVKTRILLPFLVSIGITPQQVSAERSFRLVLGRQAYDKHGTPADEAGGRLDYLVSNDGGEPLFIVECKRENLPLTEDDVAQGISYARLLEKIAPFVLVTNGRDSELYDTITRKRIEGEALGERWSAWSRGDVLSSADDLRVRAEALEYFIASSPENLRIFSNSQVDARMRSLVGATDRSRRFLPDAYIPRVHVRDAVSQFLSSDSSVFVLDAPSGHGKTNELCALARDLVQSHFVLFFRAAELWGSLSDRIAEDFNWHFSEQLPLVELVRRLARLAARCRKPIVIVIDGIDEYPSDDAPEQFSDLVRRLAEHKRLIKLLVSVKTTEWPRFAANRGVPTALRERRFLRPDDRGKETALATSATLGLFSWQDLDRALEAYRRLFQFSGNPSPELAKELADPFLLRVVAETYAGGQLPHAVGTGLLRSYIDKRIETLRSDDDRREAKQALVAAASHMASGSPTVPANACGAGLRAAVTCGILAPSFDQHDREVVAFSFDRLRDYAIAFQALRLDELSDADLGTVASSLAQHRIGQAVLRLYIDALPQSSSRHGVFAQVVYPFAGRMVQAYNRGRSRLGAHVQKEILSGLSAVSVGVVCTVYRYGEWAFGFADRALLPDDVHVVPDLWNDAARGQRDPRVVRVSTQSAWPMIADPEAFAAERLFREVTEVIRLGCLDDAQSDILCAERVFAIVSNRRSDLRVPASITWNASVGRAGLDLGPQTIEALRRSVHSYYAVQQVSMSQEFRTAQERRDYDVIERAETAARARATAGERFSSPFINNRFDTLEAALDALEAKGLEVVTHYLPPPDAANTSREARNKRGASHSLHWAYSDALLPTVIEIILDAAHGEWGPWLEANFGSVAAAIPGANEGPTLDIVHFRRESPPFDDDGTVHYGTAHNTPRRQTIVVLGAASPFSAPGVRPRQATVDGHIFSLDLNGSTGFDYLIGAGGYVGFDSRDSRSYFTPVRSLLYRRVLSAWNSASAGMFLVTATL